MRTQPPLQSTILPCGIKLNYVALPYGKSFSATLLVRAGRHNDPLDMPGLAHFTEHMAFEGGNRTISEQLSEEGVYVNACTANEHTFFVAQGHIDYLKTALQFFGNILKKTTTCETTFCREREVIQQEIEDREPEGLHKRTLAFDQYRAQVSRDPNWKRTDQVVINALWKMLPKAIDDFRKDHYCAQNATFSIVAPSQADGLLKKVSEAFKETVVDSPTTSKPPGVKRITTPNLTYSHDKFPTLWISVDYSTSRIDSAARSAASILSHHFGGGAHSEMFKRFRQGTENAYQATSDYHGWLNHLTIHNFVSTSKKHLPDALAFLLRRMKVIRDKGLNQEQLDAHVARIDRWSQTIMDQPDKLVYYSAYEALRPPEKQLVDPIQLAKSTRLLSLKEIQEATQEILSLDNRSIFVGGRVGFSARRNLRKIIARNS